MTAKPVKAEARPQWKSPRCCPVAGAAQMILRSEHHPAELKEQVTSPGGTTIAGLHALEQGGLRATLMNAVLEASERSRELGSS